MILVEETTVPQSALPVAAFKDHMRLGSGFSDEGLQDDVLEVCLRSALAAIEARTGKILMSRTFSWTVSRWRDKYSQPLPVAPISDITAMTLIDREGVEADWPATSWHLERDTHRPHLVADKGALPTAPNDGAVRVSIVAGYAATWDAIPADITRAVLLLAAHFYEFRYDTGGAASRFPSVVDNLIAPHRTVRLLGGSRL